VFFVVLSVLTRRDGAGEPAPEPQPVAETAA
jgi:hypothetical protein